MQALGSLWQRIGGGPRERQALAFMRVAMGAFFLYQGYHKFTTPAFLKGMAPRLANWAAENPIPLYREFLQSVAIPNAEIFGALVMFGEMLVGLSLIAGFLTQFSLPAAVFMNLNFLLATQHTGPASLGINLAFIILGLGLWWGRAGLVYGLDACVFRKDAAKAPAFKPKGSKKLSAIKDSLEKAQKSGGKKKSKKSKPF